MEEQAVLFWEVKLRPECVGVVGVGYDGVRSVSMNEVVMISRVCRLPVLFCIDKSYSGAVRDFGYRTF